MSFLDFDRISEAVTLPADGLPPDQGVDWVAGLDPAFSSDPCGLCIAGRSSTDWRRLVVGKVASWKPSRGSSSSFQEKRATENAVLREVAGVCRRYDVSRVVTDQYAAAQVVERLRNEGLYVVTRPMTAASKTEVYGELRIRLNLGEIDIPDDAELLSELRRLRSKFTAGSASVVNPRVSGSHGDKAQALAMAVYEHRRPSDPEALAVIAWDFDGATRVAPIPYDAVL